MGDVNITVQSNAIQIEVSGSPGADGLANIVEDTTPQLGGNLDQNDFYIDDVQVAAATGTDTLTCDMDNKKYGIFTFAKTVNVTSIVFSNQVAGVEGGAIIEITDDGGADTIAYNASWREAGGTAMSVTTSGVDRWLITWNDSSTAGTYVVSQQLDVKAS